MNLNDFMEIFGTFNKILKKINIEPPEELKHLIELYDDLNTGDIPSGNAELSEVVSNLHKLERFGEQNEFLLHKEIEQLGNIQYGLYTLIFVPTEILSDIEDKTIKACYKAVITLSTKKCIDSILLNAIFERSAVDILKDICYLNSIYLNDDNLSDLSSCNFHKVPESGEIINQNNGTVEMGEKAAREIIHCYTLKWNLPNGITKEEAIKLTKEKFNLWKRLRGEMSYGLGL